MSSPGFDFYRAFQPSSGNPMGTSGYTVMANLRRRLTHRTLRHFMVGRSLRM
jgi:hypothetical protein